MRNGDTTARRHLPPFIVSENFKKNKKNFNSEKRIKKKHIFAAQTKKNVVMKVFAFAKEPEVKPGLWYLEGYYGDIEKAVRRTIYEKGKIITIINFPDKYKKFVAYK